MLLLTSSVFAQGKIKEKALGGSWYACNANDAYYNSDTIILSSTPAAYDCCEEVVWWLKKRNFRKYDNKCSDKFNTKDTERNYNGRYSVIENKKLKYLLLFKGDNICEKFQILCIENISNEDAGDNYTKLTLRRISVQ